MYIYICRVDGALLAKIQQFKVLLLARRGRDKSKGPEWSAEYAQQVAESIGCGAPPPIPPSKRDLLQCQKRPTTVSKETYYSVKRDPLQCQKRPTTPLPPSPNPQADKSMPPGLEELQ